MSDNEGVAWALIINHIQYTYHQPISIKVRLLAYGLHINTNYAAVY